MVKAVEGNRQTDRQTGRQADRQTDRQTQDDHYNSGPEMGEG